VIFSQIQLTKNILNEFLQGGEFEIDEDYMIKSKDVVGLFVAQKEEVKKEEEAPAPVVEAAAPVEEEVVDDAKKKKKKKKKAAK